MALAAALACLLPSPGFAIQLHQGSEGIIVHQFGHSFFLLSMVVLIFTITGKSLNQQKGWGMIQVSAFFFILWNLSTLAAHFLDNQIEAVVVENISLWQVKITAESGSDLLVHIYHALKLDHLLCVPAIFFLYRGLSLLLKEAQQEQARKIKTDPGDNQGRARQEG